MVESARSSLSQDEAERDQFNSLVPFGTPVAYWPGVRRGPGVLSETRSAAWLLGDGVAVVLVEGYSGGIALTHVLPYPPGKPTPPAEDEGADVRGAGH